VFLEVTEILRCPRVHDESFVVCVAYAMDGRQVARGVIGCPVCQEEFPITDGVARFDAPAAGEGPGPGQAAATTDGPQPGLPGTERRSAAAPLTAEATAAFLALEGRGGYVLLAGSAARLARDLAALVPGVHLLCVNAPLEAERVPECSYVASLGGFPIKSAQVRGVVLGADCVAEPWLAEGVRVLLHGLRLVAEDERASPAGIVELARGAGVLVGEKRTR
jgi:uncharacterized protein YbaR (Trm112 family)